MSLEGEVDPPADAGGTDEPLDVLTGASGTEGKLDPLADASGTDEPFNLLTGAGGSDPTSAKFCRNKAPPPIGVRNKRVQLFPDFLPPSDSA